MDPEEQQGNNLSALVKNAPAIRQVLLLVGLAISICVGLATAMWLRDSAYTTLYSNLDGAEAAEVVQTLQSSGIEYELDQRSGAILVPQDSVYEARMTLDSAGLPRGAGFGMEIIQAESGITSSQAMEAARLKYAMETELSRTLSGLQPIRSARVHLGLPQSSVFVRDRKPRTASVKVDLYPGQSLGGQVRGIAQIVAGGVPGLEPGDVTVVDQYGNPLSGGGVDDDLALSERQLSYVREIESNKVDRILTLLGPLVGPENVRASVTAEVDFTVQEESREQFDPANTVVRSEQIQEDRNNSAATTPAGVPGALSNTPPQVGPAAANAAQGANVNNSGSESVRQTRNFEVDRTMSVTRYSSGDVTRLSVAVVIDDAIAAAQDAEADADAGDVAGQSIDEIIAYADQLVRQAVGFTEARGDTVMVTTATFHEPPPLPEMEEPSYFTSPAFFSILRQGLSVVAILLVGFGLVRPIVRMLTAPSPAPAQAVAALSGGGSAMIAGQLSYDDKVGAVRQLVDKDSERVARIVKGWVGEDA